MNGHVVYGSDAFPHIVNATNLNGQDGFTLTIPLEGSGIVGSVEVTGGFDLNNDGYSDVGLIYGNGFPDHIADGYIVYGARSHPAKLLSTDIIGKNGTRLVGRSPEDEALLTGASITFMRDINGDGIADFATHGTSGPISVVFGV